MNYEIYIKGCYEPKGNTASFSFVLLKGNAVVEKLAAKYEGEFKTRNGAIEVLKGKGQYQAELCALAWTLFHINDAKASIKVYSNNKAVVRWLNYRVCPDEYTNLLSICMQMGGDRISSAEWIAKASNNQWNTLVNTAALELTQMKGKSIIKTL